MFRIRKPMMALGALLCAAAVCAAAEDAPAQNDLEGLRKRVEKLEQASNPANGTVQPANKGVVIKLDGRLFAGVFSTGKQAYLPNRSLDIPDAKLRFTLVPSPNVVLVNRLSTTRAGFSGLTFDYFYLDLLNWHGLLPGHTLRLGKHKIDVGEETFTDNPVESNLIVNSVGHVSGYDEGISLRGPITRKGVLSWYSAELLNGTSGFTGSAAGLAWGGKLGVSPLSQTYFSASYYRGSRTPLSGPDFSVADLRNTLDNAATGAGDLPHAATGWRRTLWEADARYGFGREGVKSAVGVPVDVPFQVAGAFGHFAEEFTGVGTGKGGFWYAEGLYNITPQLYAATRYSQLCLTNGAKARIGDGGMQSPVPVSRYQRLGLGLGYRLTRLTLLKAEYTINDATGGTPYPHLNQLAVGVATKF